MLHYMGKRGLSSAMLCVLVACGGGGGGAGNQVAGAPTGQVPAPGALPDPPTLAITEQNTQDVATVAPVAGTLLLSIGRIAADYGDRFAVRGDPLRITENCSEHGGSLTLALDDKDGSGAASAGDTIAVDMRDCYNPTLIRIVTGSMTIELAGVEHRPFGKIAGVVRTAGLAGADLGIAPKLTSTLIGSLQFESVVSTSGSAITVNATAADDMRVVVAGAQALTDDIQHFSFSKSVDLGRLRSTIAMHYHHRSDLLKGSFDVSTVAPLTVERSSRMASGSISVTGLNSGLALTPDTSGKTNRYTVTRTDVAQGPTTIAWAPWLTGFLWWDEYLPLRWSETQYPYVGFSYRPDDADTVFSASGWLHDSRDDASSSATFRLLFEREVLPLAPGMHFRFHDLGDIDDMNGLDKHDVDADMAQDGAVLVFRPRSQLRHHRSYMLQGSFDGVTWNGSNDLVFKAALGHSFPFSTSSLLSFDTPDSLHPAITAPARMLLSRSDTVRLSGEASTSSRLAISSYKWTQLSGTPLRLSAPDSAVTDVAWADTAPTGVESPVLQLTVTNLRGETESTTLALTSSDPGSLRTGLFFTSAPGDPIGHGATVVSTDDASTLIPPATPDDHTVIMYIPRDWQRGWLVLLYTADRSPLRKGHYDNATAARLPGATNALSFYYGSGSCLVSYGSFDVLDIGYDGAGKISTLAIDFEQRCDRPDAPALLGSYRYNSPLPLRH